MVRTDAVSPPVFDMLDQLMGGDYEAFSLGGGTSLALRFGHRESIDLDLFTISPFDSILLQESLRYHFGKIEIRNRTEGSLCIVSQGVRIDFLLHAYPLLQPVEKIHDIRVLSLPDIAAMKINAVTNRGSKKDFSDLLLLHDNGLDIELCLEFFCRKYGGGGKFLAIRSLMYFEDARSEPDPVFLNHWTWDSVEARMRHLVSRLL